MFSFAQTASHLDNNNLDSNMFFYVLGSKQKSSSKIGFILKETKEGEVYPIVSLTTKSKYTTTLMVKRTARGLVRDGLYFA